MPDALTPNYGWTLPTVGADFGTWGGLLNGNLSLQDTQVYNVQTTANNAMPKTGGTFTGRIVVEYPSAQQAPGAIAIDGPTGYARSLDFTTSGLLRWQMYLGSAVETGGNAGANLNFGAYADNGAYLFPVMSFARTTGLVTINNGLTVAAGSLTVAAGQISVNGSITVNTAGGASNLFITGPAATSRAIYYETNGLVRWVTYAGGDAESGSNAGSTFYIARYNDAGAGIDNPISISRATGQVTVGPGGLISAGAVWSNVNFTVNGAPGTTRFLYFASNGVSRWAILVDSAAESGSNVGSNFYIQRFNDAGAWVENPFSINRANGQVMVGAGGLAVNGPLTVNDPTVNSITSLQLINTTANGANFKMTGNGATTPSKTFRVINGGLQIINSGYTASIFGLDDTGLGTFSNSVKCPNLFIADGPVINRGLQVNTNGVTRWQVLGDGTAESGGNVGTNFAVARYNDSGAYVDEPLTIQRTTGLVNINDGLVVGGATTHNGGSTHNGATVLNATGVPLVMNQTNWTVANVDINWNVNGGQYWVTSCRSVAGTFDWWLFNNNTGVAVMSATRSNNVCVFNAPITNGSDLRQKSEIEPVTRALATVEKLKGVFFKSTLKGLEDRRQVGLVAQDVAKVLPEVVFEGETEGDDGPMLSIAYSPLVAVLIEAVKELTGRVRALEAAR